MESKGYYVVKNTKGEYLCNSSIKIEERYLVWGSKEKSEIWSNRSEAELVANVHNGFAVYLTEPIERLC